PSAGVAVGAEDGCDGPALGRVAPQDGEGAVRVAVSLDLVVRLEALAQVAHQQLALPLVVVDDAEDGKRMLLQPVQASASRTQRSTSTRTSCSLYSTLPFESSTAPAASAARAPAERSASVSSVDAPARAPAASVASTALGPTDPTATRASEIVPS